MTKSKHVKKNFGISPEHLAELRCAALLASTGASVRLSGSKVTDKEVGQIVNTVFGRK